MEDDGFLKEHFGECPQAVEECWSPGPAAPSGWVGEEPESLLLLPGREPLVALGLLCGREATCHSGEGGAKIKDSGGYVCGGDCGRPWDRVGDQSLPALARRSEMGSGHGTGQSLSLCSSDKASWHCARARGDAHLATGCCRWGCLGEGGRRDSAAGLPPGRGLLELARPALEVQPSLPFALWCSEWPWQGLCVPSQSLRAVQLVCTWEWCVCVMFLASLESQGPSCQARLFLVAL